MPSYTATDQPCANTRVAFILSDSELTLTMNGYVDEWVRG